MAVNSQIYFSTKLPRSYVESSDYEIIRKIMSDYRFALRAKKDQIEMNAKAWKFAFAWQGEMWDETAVRYKEARHLRAPQYDIVGPKVRTFTGMLMQNKFDLRYNPEDGVRNTGVEALENANFADEELHDYDYQEGLVVRDGVIHHGDLEFYIRCDKDPMGRIGVRRAQPGAWVFDPYWVSDDERECTQGWKRCFLTLREMLSMWDLPDSPLMDKELDRIKRLGMDYSKIKIDDMSQETLHYENRYEVIEWHFVEEIKKDRLVAYSPLVNKWVPFPITDKNEDMEDFAGSYGIQDWKESAFVVPYYDKIDYCAICCFDLFPTKLIEKGKPEIQIKGLPVIQFTCDRDMTGRDKGITMALMDVNLDLNYAMAKRQEILANSVGGGKVADRSKLSDEKDQQDFSLNSNDPTRTWFVDGNPEGFFKHLNDKQISPDIMRTISESFDISDRVSNVSAAWSSQTQNANEPFKLYDAKLKVNKVGQATEEQRYRRLIRTIKESYFYQAQISYSDGQRFFSSKDGTKKSILNEDMGNGVTRNKVDEISRVSVSLIETTDSPNKQIRDSLEMGALLQSMPKEYGEHVAIIVGELAMGMGISAEKKERIEEATKIEQVKARTASLAAINQNIAAIQQNELMSTKLGQELQMLQQSLAGQPQQAPVEEMLTQEPQSGPPKQQLSFKVPEPQQTTTAPIAEEEAYE
jgi:hypothetical protein